MQNELKWVSEARSNIGLSEIVGAKHNAKILEMWKTGFTATGQVERLKEKVWQNDETAWCGGFIAYIFAKVGLVKHIPKYFPMARAWAKVGTKLDMPAYGCLVVFSRGNMGHVGIVVGQDKNGNLMVLGGNQANAVNIKPFSKNRVIAYRWCGTQDKPYQSRYDLPILTSDGKLSTNEA